nr:hypothetical protein [uncultured Macellibacteroides sp.]
MESLNKLRDELSLKARNGIDFTLSATLIWLLVAVIWSLSIESYYKSVLVFMVSSLLLPTALGLSKLLKTKWKIEENPLQPLGLWLNFAQLFYFPFLIFTLVKMPDYFIMTYAIITGAHLFPYAWLYKTKWYAILAGVIAVGALILALILPSEQMFIVALYTSFLLFVLTVGLYFDVKRRKR